MSLVRALLIAVALVALFAFPSRAMEAEANPEMNLEAAAEMVDAVAEQLDNQVGTDSLGGEAAAAESCSLMRSCCSNGASSVCVSFCVSPLDRHGVCFGDFF
jgi:hypothetical protein